ncbi:MAG: hypothetical protein AB1632_08950 [Nitrospirota bacterium]
MKKQILYVAYEDEDMDDGLSYAVDLAKTMDKDIALLIANRKRTIADRFDDLMAAVTFAEADEHETARRIMTVDNKKKNGEVDKKVIDIAEKYQSAGINIKVHSLSTDAVSAVKDVLKRIKGIDMVLLSPHVTENGNLSARELNKLVQTASRPIVTLARHAFVT